LKYLFDKIGEIAKRLKTAKKILLLSDYDGTLTPIVDRPELARMGYTMRKLLKQIARLPNAEIGILSGRPLSDLKKLVNIKGIYYAGNHGFEIEGPSGRFIHSQARKSLSLLAAIAEDLRSKLKGIKGAIVEDKGLSLSVHYRMVSTSGFPKLKKYFDQAVGKFLKGKKIKVTQGKKVFEIRPPAVWHKGKALLWILQKLEGKKASGTFLPIYLGDDLTDEDAFAAMPKRGISIFVGGFKSSRAKYQLKSVWEVELFLDILKEKLGASK
jgi:trehalose 6-phosphate phosphatase